MKLFREVKRSADAGKPDLSAPDDDPETSAPSTAPPERDIDARGQAWRHSQLRRPE
jgi:hypothetical protein